MGWEGIARVGTGWDSEWERGWSRLTVMFCATVREQHHDDSRLPRVLRARIWRPDDAVCWAGVRYAVSNDTYPPLRASEVWQLIHIFHNPGRECYCGAYLSALSDPLNATAKCDYACNGNASEICGGELAISLYNLTASSSSTDKTGIGWSLAAGQPMWYAVAAFVTFVVAALL